MSIRFFPLLILLGAGTAGFASTEAPTSASASPAKTNVPTVVLDRLIVVGELDRSSEAIAPSLGASEYQIDRHQIGLEPQGASAPFNQVLLRAPGMAQDSFGQLHLRGEHAGLQYRINDVLLPEGLSGSGIGVGAPQYGARRAVFGGVSWIF